MELNATKIFEKLYNTYSPLMYGIALEMSQTQKEAEKILIATFQKLSKKNLIRQNTHCLFAMLIKLTIQTVKEQTRQKTPINLNLFKNTPLLQKLFCEELTLESYCNENKLTLKQGNEKVREELNKLKKFHFQEK